MEKRTEKNINKKKINNKKLNKKVKNDHKQKWIDFSDEWYEMDVKRFSLLKVKDINDNIPIIDNEDFFKAFGLSESDNNMKVLDMYYDKKVREKLKNMLDKNLLSKIPYFCSKKAFQTSKSTQNEASRQLEFFTHGFLFDIGIGIALSSKIDNKGKKHYFIKINVSDILLLISLYIKISYMETELEVDPDEDTIVSELYISRNVYNHGNALIYETKDVSYGIFMNNKRIKKDISSLLARNSSNIVGVPNKNKDDLIKIISLYKKAFKDIKVVKFKK